MMAFKRHYSFGVHEKYMKYMRKGWVQVRGGAVPIR